MIDGREGLRIAGISSFGAGGSNAHVMVEEWIDERPVPDSMEQPAVLVLSAKDEERLGDMVRNLHQILTDRSDLNLHDIAFTLQTGREAMEERLAMVVNSVEELTGKLAQWIERPDEVADLYRGQVRGNVETMAGLTADEDMAETIERWVAKGKFDKLLDLWVQGFAFDWRRLYSENRPRRISLPTYPFARERCWVQADAPVRVPEPAPIETEEEPYELLTFEEVWDEEALPAPSSDEPKTLLCFLSDPVRREEFTETLKTLAPQVEPIFVGDGAAWNERARYEDALETVRMEHGDIDAVLYLRPLEEKPAIESLTLLLQALTTAKL
ncbi:MAG: ketoacyl-synthetase C-terminal extension domain-containing protein, partial [Verrucomicrobiota bacterium]